MPRFLRRYLLGCIAIAFAYLLWHATEPLRLDVGDPWSDAELVSSVTGRSASSNVVGDSPLSAIVYGAIAKVGVADVAVFRLFALAFSALGAWALFHYLRRMWSDSVAFLGTALFATSLLSLMHADSLQAPPLEHAACFIALWGVARAIETEQLRHYAAIAVGSFACMFAGSDDGLFLAAGTLCAVYGKRGDPLARGSFRFVAVCAAGAVAGLVASSHVTLDADDWLRTIDTRSAARLVPLLTTTFTPMLWIAVATVTWRALRSPSLRAALDDAMSWLLVVAIIVVFVTSPRVGPPMLRVVSVLPFFAVGSAIMIDRVIQRDRVQRALGIAWIVAATVWAVPIMAGHTRAVLPRDDVSAARTYFASHDGNDFVLNNLLSDGVIRAAFDRGSWSAMPENDDATAERGRVRMLEMFEAAGTDYAHAVVFKSPESRFVDRSLAQLARFRRFRMTAWPYLQRTKADDVIRRYDDEVRQLLEATGAQRVLQLEEFDVYRIDRRSVLEQASRSLPVTRKLDFSSPASNQYKLLGWAGPKLSEWRKFGVSSIGGYAACANPLLDSRPGGPATSACETISTKAGLFVPDARLTRRAQLILRVERACDLRFTVELEPESSPLWLVDVTSPAVGVAIGGYTASTCESEHTSFVVPKRFVHDGINVVTFSTDKLGPLNPRADLRSLEIEPLCDAPP